MLQSWTMRLKPFKGKNKKEGSGAGPSLCPPPEGILHTGCVHNASCEAVNGGPGPGSLISQSFLTALDYLLNIYMRKEKIQNSLVKAFKLVVFEFSPTCCSI